MKTLEYRDGALHLLDQRQLPLIVEVIACRDHHRVAQAIRTLSVRGAPAIGLAAAYGAALAARRLVAEGVTGEAFYRELGSAMAELRATRPTAVNLAWALDRMTGVLAEGGGTPSEVADLLLREADRMLAEDEEANRRMGSFGAALIPDGSNVLTHCNAGALATGAYGTALGVIRAAHEQGKRVHVWVDETRPLLQGARLTTWELQQLGIPCTLITDNMAGHIMRQGRIDLALVGADRIAANGDTANKIGTYTVAVLCNFHERPFYVAAPATTVDLSLASGAGIPIEERGEEEVRGFRQVQASPPGIAVANPAFDVTPAALIDAIITDRGVAARPYQETLPRRVAELV